MPSRPPDDPVPALIDAPTGRSVTHRQLETLVAAATDRLPDTKSLVAVYLSHTIEAVVYYLAARAGGHAVMVLDPAAPAGSVAGVAEAYRPEIVYREDGPPGPAYTSEAGDTGGDLYRRAGSDEMAVHPDLALLLPTSGTTGSPKFVRLSEAAVAANTAAISAALALSGGDRAITNVPLSYSYGLSILNTHLHVGAGVVLSSSSVIESAFWEAVRRHAVTSLAGVPYTYRMLERVGFRSMDLPSLTTMTQAGGHLTDDLVVAYSQWMSSRGGGLYVMYGQTEAAPRMTCLAPAELPGKVGSVGRPLEGGRLEIHVDGIPAGAPGVVGEVVYRGPNVMMGYATGRADLAEGDTRHGLLMTGDMGYLDPDGYLWLTGRSKRIAKLFGSRVSLDDVEALFAACGPVAAVAGEDRVVIHHEPVDAAVLKRCRLGASKALRVPPSAISTRDHPGGLPTAPNGKIDYLSLDAAGAGP